MQMSQILASELKLNEAVLKLLHLCGITAQRVIPLLRIEQDYLTVDQSLFFQRPDLVAAGRTLFGVSLPNYQKSTNARVAAFDLEVEKEALRLGTFHFEPAQVAIENNRKLIEFMQHIAPKYSLACLLHQRPFKGIPELRKRMYWTLATDQGIRLIQPQEKNLASQALLVAILKAAYENETLLQTSIASAENDLQPHFKLIQEGDHFELKGVGASRNSIFPVCTLNAVVADQLQLIVDEIADVLGNRKWTGSALLEAAFPVLKKHQIPPHPVSHKTRIDFSSWIDKKTARIFEGIFTEAQLQYLYESQIQEYVKTVNIETNLMVEIFGDIEESVELKKMRMQMGDLGWEAKAKVFSELVAPKMAELRAKVDALEMNDALGHLPRYKELLS